MIVLSWCRYTADCRWCDSTSVPFSVVSSTSLYSCFYCCNCSHSCSFLSLLFLVSLLAWSSSSSSLPREFGSDPLLWLRTKPNQTKPPYSTTAFFLLFSYFLSLKVDSIRRHRCQEIWRHRVDVTTEDAAASEETVQYQVYHLQCLHIYHFKRLSHNMMKSSFAATRIHSFVGK